MSYFAVSVLLLRYHDLRFIKAGFLTFATLIASLGLVDLFGKASGAGDVLASLRTANYALLVDVQVEGFWRIVGGHPEASGFAVANLVALAFTFSYWRTTRIKAGPRPVAGSAVSPGLVDVHYRLCAPRRAAADLRDC